MNDAEDTGELRQNLGGAEISPAIDDPSVALVRLSQPLPALFRMPLPTVESWISALGIVRAFLKPEIPQEAPGGMRIGVVDPRYEVTFDPLTGHTNLLLRDSRYGWLTFSFPPAAAHAIAERLETGSYKQPRVDGNA